MADAAWLVTGSAGFLGSHVVSELLRRGQRVVGVDDMSWGRAENLPEPSEKLFILEKADIRSRNDIEAVFERHHPDRVIHLAALHFIPAAIANPDTALSINVHGTQVMLSAALRHGVRSFWFASTGDVYQPSALPHSESSKIEPFNIYGLSKWMGEMLIALESRNNASVHFCIGRLFNLYGSRETNPHIIPEILKQLKTEPKAKLRLGSVWPKRDFVPVKDAARAAIDLSLAAPQGLTTVNVATGSCCSVEDMLSAMGELLGHKLEIETDLSRVRTVERPHLQADIRAIHSLLGWSPRADIRQGLAELLSEEGLLKA